MKTIGIGIIGADGRGRIFRQAHQPDRGIHIRAASSRNVEGIADISEEIGAEVLVTDDYRRVLSFPGIDAVIISTPDFLHEEHAMAAIQAGKHLFLEKPMGITIESCDRIRQAAQEKGVLLYVGHNMRFFPVIRKMKELIDAGRIGQVQAIWCRHFISYGGDAYFKDWHSEQQYVNGLLLQKGAHDIDVIHWLAGSYAQRVVGMGKLSVYDELPRRAEGEVLPVVVNVENWPPETTSGYSPKIDVEDHSMILMQHANHVQSSYLQCHYTPDDVRNYTIIGTKGRMENYGDMPLEDKPASIQIWDRRTGYERDGHEVIDLPVNGGTHGGADPLMIEDFISALRGSGTTAATSLDARMAVAVGVLGTQSLRNNNVPYDVSLPVGSETDF